MDAVGEYSCSMKVLYGVGAPYDSAYEWLDEREPDAERELSPARESRPEAADVRPELSAYVSPDRGDVGAPGAAARSAAKRAAYESRLGSAAGGGDPDERRGGMVDV